MKYRTIVADPPWEYHANRGILTKGHGPATAEAHYMTMSNAEIAALPIKEQAADSAHLYMWVTNPRLFGQRRDREIQPIDIMEAWGFEYRTMLTWHKLGSLGMGFHFRGDTEHVLFGVRGDIKIDASQRVSNHFAARKGLHSQKPDRFYEIVERVSPGPYLEMFARRRRYGWDVWGNEAPTEQASQATLDLGVA